LRAGLCQDRPPPNFGFIDELEGAVQRPEWWQLGWRSKLAMVALAKELHDGFG
jgi:hypothetical protein